MYYVTTNPSPECHARIESWGYRLLSRRDLSSMGGGPQEFVYVRKAST